jgi:hypothetical protein
LIIKFFHPLDLGYSTARAFYPENSEDGFDSGIVV